MPTIIIDNQPYEIKEGQNLLEACLGLGLNLPYFCWHPAMGSVGACRQCAVKQYRDEHDQKGRLVMACMTPATDGTRISILDPEAANFRASVIEWMMMSHPHDCPICDEGGECHLQDMTVMTGHDYRRFRGLKRTFRNQDLGPFVNQEMNRCIQCYRCVRFYRDYAGGHDFDAFLLHDTVFYGRKEPGTLESEFSGNLVEICPTGVFTDKTLKKHFTRKWDLQTAPSICVNCSLGCNTIPGERYGMLRRIRNRYNGEVNGYFLCDRGRYGYEFVNSDRRISKATIQSRAESLSRDAVVHSISEMVKSGKTIGIGSPRASLEANFALRTLVGPDRFYAGIPAREATLIQTILANLKAGPAHSPSLQEIGKADAVLILGEDVTNTAPMMALALRQAVRQKPLEQANQQNLPLWNDSPVRNFLQDQKGPLFVASVVKTRLDDVATRTFHGSIEEIARLGYAVAHEVDEKAPLPKDLDEGTAKLAHEIAEALKSASRPVVISGTGCAHEGPIQAAAQVAWALCAMQKPTGLSYIVPESNSMGLGLMDARPLEDASQAVTRDKADTIIVLENDLARRMGSDWVKAFFEQAPHVVAVDSLVNTTTQMAEVVLPATTFAEGDGTLVNNEGRAQRYFAVMVPKDEMQDSWRWIGNILSAAGQSEADQWENQDQVLKALAKQMPAFAPVLSIAPEESFRIDGQKIPRQSARYSGRTAMLANISVHEPKPPQDPDSPLAFSMEGTTLQPPSALIPRFWAPGWNSIQSLNKYQEEIAGMLRGGDPGKRLIEAPSDARPDYKNEIPAPFFARQGEWQAVPLFHIYGSEEMSMLSPGVAQRAPQAYIAMNPQDAQTLQIQPGDEITLVEGSMQRAITVRLMAEITPGLVGYPAGLPGLEGIVPLSWVQLRTAASSQAGG